MTMRGVDKGLKFVGALLLLGTALLLVLSGEAEKRSTMSGSKRTAAASNTAGAAKQSPHWAEAYGRLPLSFEENQGQTSREVRYLSHGKGFELFLTPQEAVLALRQRRHVDFSPRHRSETIRSLREANKARATQPQLTALRLQLEGANPSPQIGGMERLPTRVNYFVGNDPKNWHTDVPAYSKVKYSEVYPGVDLVFYGNQRKLEYDFVVAPGADPSKISLKVDGTSEMRLNARGDLALRVPGGEVELQKPVVYQMVKGERHEIEGRYAIRRDHRVAFTVASYNRNEPLIVDPVLLYSTYLGGSATEDFTPAASIAVDSSGNAFVAGQTTSTDFPAGSKGGVITPPAANSGASFVAELDPTGANLLYSTYLAGSTTSSGDSVFGVAVDSTGKVYVTGQTFATDFPTTTATAFNPGPVAAAAVNGTVFLTKLDPTVNGAAALLYSTYISGTGGEFANCIAVDSSGNAYVAGNTASLTDFPTTANALQAAPSATNPAPAFVTRIDTTKSGINSLIFSTYFGGNGANAPTFLGLGEAISGIAVDSSQNVYVAGATSSTDAPPSFITSTTAYQTAPPVANTRSSVFFSKINTTAGTLAYSTYLAGSTQDQAFAIALGSGNVAYITGQTDSTDYPLPGATSGAFDTVGAASGKAFITRVDATKSGSASVTYSTFLGGTGGDDGNGIAVDGSGNAYVVGFTQSTDFGGVGTLDALGALQTSRLNAGGDAFVAKLNPAGGGKSDLLYATYYGGSGDGADPDEGFGIAVDSANPPNAYIAGETFSTDLPVLSAFQSKLNGNGNAAAGNSDAFVAKLAMVPSLTVSPTSFDFGTQPVGVASSAQAFTVTNNTATTATFTSIVTNGTTPAANTDFAISNDACSPSGVGAGLTCIVNVKFTPSVAAAEAATLVITATATNGGQASTIVLNVNLTGTGSNAAIPAVSLSTNTVTFNPQMVTTKSASMPVTLTNVGTGPLTINSIAASGDFAQTNTCPASPSTLPATAGSNSCTINVTVTPTSTGARSGTLTITDNAGGSPHTVTLSGTGWDFTVTATTPQSGKSPLTFNATLTSVGGFNQSVSFTCTGAPTGSTCSVPSSVTANAATPQSVQVTLTKTGSGLFVPPGPLRLPPFRFWQIVPLMLVLSLVFLMSRIKGLRIRLAFVAAALLLVLLAGCGGLGSSHKLTGNITITGTSSGSAGAVSHSAQVTFTLN